VSNFVMSIKAIALNTFREGVRNRIMYNLVFFAVAMIVFSYFVGEVSIGSKLKVMQDMGLSSISIFGILIAIFVGIGLVYKEVDKRTIYTIISKPIERYQFLLGKFFGLAITMLVQVVFMTIFMYLVLYLTVKEFNPDLLKAVVLIYMEVLLIISVALFFSSFTTPFLSALFCIGFFIIGHSTVDLYDASLKTESILFEQIARTMKYFNLDHFNIVGKIVHGVDIGWDWVFEVMLYGFFWVAVFIILASVIFRRKDFK